MFNCISPAILIVIIIFFIIIRDDKEKDNSLNVKGTGIVRNGRIYYKAILWHCDDIDNFKEGEKVEVLETNKNKVKIKKK